MAFVKYVAIPTNYFDLLKGSSTKATEIKEEISEPVQVEIIDSSKKETVKPETPAYQADAPVAPGIKRKRKPKSTAPRLPPPGIRDKQTGWIIP